jgi:hypothetical protein
VTTLDERMARTEGRVEEQSHALVALRDAFGRLEQRVDARFDAVDRRFDALERKFEAFRDRSDARFDALDDKISRQFLWIVGIQITTLVAVVGAVLSRA